MAERPTAGACSLRPAVRADLPDLARFIQAYYRFEGVPFDLYRLERGLVPLIGREDLGRVWVIEVGTTPIGYLVLCFGYSIEKGGRDAMVDELYIEPGYRRRGLGRQALQQALVEARAAGVVSVFLEVDRDNEIARRLYAGVGFTAREKFSLMCLDFA